MKSVPKSAGRNLLAVMAPLFLAACAPTMAGRLVGAGGEPVSGREARVNISSLSPAKAVANDQDAAATEVEELRSVIVDVGSDGVFKTTAALAPGPYLVEALVPGFAPESRRVMLGETEDLEIQLKPTAKVVPGVISANMSADPGRGAGGATLTPPSL